MKLVVKRATPAAIAVLRQATALWPKRKKASDGAFIDYQEAWGNFVIQAKNR